jgi:hypothetical protein
MRTAPSFVVNVPPAQRNLIEELQNVDMTATDRLSSTASTRITATRNY